MTTPSIPTRSAPRLFRSRPPGRAIAALLALAGLACAAALPHSALAHEFWIAPEPFNLAPGGSTRLSLDVGENFAGERIGITPQFLVSFRRFSAGAEAIDLRPTVPPIGPVGEVAVALPRAGTHLIAIDTLPSHISLPADKFNAYLHDEGLDAIVRAREAAGTAGMPSRERFRRNIKVLLQAGRTTDATHAVRTGQRLELVPLVNPYRRAAGMDIGFQVFFDGAPLAGALVKSWHRKGEQTLIVRTVTDAEGKVTVTPPWPGMWMISVVHMVPVTDTPEYDWDSYWGNLTFELPAMAAGRAAR